jgi:hypothetical protein
MKKTLSIIALSFLLSGCLDFSMLVKINTDGSGTIEETVLMNKEMLDEMKSMAEAFGSTDDAIKKDFNMIDEKKLAEEARSMGEGVSFIKAEPLTRKDQMGYIAYFSFKDINKLSVNENPSGKNLLDQKQEDHPSEEPIKFSFERGTPAKLVIHLAENSSAPDSIQKESQESTPDASDTSGLAMMAAMFKGLRLSVAIEFNGTIKETNATYANGSKVILMDLDFDQITSDKEKFYEISRHNPESALEMKKILEKIPGIKMETSKEIRVNFQ